MRDAVMRRAREIQIVYQEYGLDKANDWIACVERARKQLNGAERRISSAELQRMHLDRLAPEERAEVAVNQLMSESRSAQMERSGGRPKEGLYYTERPYLVGK